MKSYAFLAATLHFDALQRSELPNRTNIELVLGELPGVRPKEPLLDVVAPEMKPQRTDREDYCNVIPLQYRSKSFDDSRYSRRPGRSRS